MKKRSRLYMQSKRHIKFLSKLIPLIDSYQLAQLKIQQLKNKPYLLIGRSIDVEKLQLETNLDLVYENLCKILKP